MFILGFVDSQDIFTIIETANQQFEVFRVLWEEIGQSNVLAGLLLTGRYFVVGSLVVYAYLLYKRFLDELDWRPILQAMIGPLIFLLLLGSPANPSQSGVWIIGKQVPSIIRKINEEISINFVKDVNLQKESQVYRAERYIEEIIRSKTNECLEIVDEQAQTQCINTQVVPLRPRLLEALQSTQQRMQDGKFNSGRFFEEFLNTIDTYAATGQRNGFQRLGSALSRGITDFILDALATLITMVGWGVGYCVEIAFIIAAVLGPLAIGLSLLPLPTKPIYSWLIGYIGIAVFRISLTLVVGLSAYVLNRTQDFTQTGYILFALVVGVFGPVVAGTAGSWSATSILEGTQSSMQKTGGLVIGGAAATLGTASLVVRTVGKALTKSVGGKE